MTLRGRFRLIAGLAVANVSLVVAAGAGAWIEARRAQRAEASVHALLRATVEDGFLRDEYITRGSASARQELERRRPRFGELLASARGTFSGPEAEELLDDLSEGRKRWLDLLGTLDATLGRKASGAADPEEGVARGRIVSALLVASYETYSNLERLADHSAREVRSASQTIAILLGGLLILTVGSAGLTAWAAGPLVARRVAALVQGAERLASGDLEHRLRLQGADELATVGGAFDAMAERLADADAARQRDAARIRTLNAELERNLARVQASNQELEAFSYSVSHDLRAPLRHVVGFVQFLRQHLEASTRLDEKGAHYMQVIAEAAARMGVLIDDLLAFARTGRTAMSQQEVDLGALAREVVGEVGAAAGGAVAWDIGELPAVVGDRAMLRQVLANLLGNAVKFSRGRPQARVAVEAESTPEEIRVRVRDNGVGFDGRYAHKLFGVFQRLHRAEEFEGNGVGLATVQRIVHRHGGKVGATSELGAGATFWFTLPRQEERACP